MGNLINPLGGRVNLINFWRNTWPIHYQNEKQDLYHQLAIHIRVLFNCFFRKVFNLKLKQKKKKRFGLRTGILHGLVIKILSNVWGFQNENLSIYLKFFDYNATVEMTKAIPHRFYFQRLFSGLFSMRDMLNLLKVKPLVLSSFKKKNFFLLSEGFLSKLQGRIRKPFRTFSKRLKKFMKRAFLSFKRVLTRRVKAWHVNLIVFTKPYLFYLCKLFTIKKCFVFGSIQKSSISAAMVARYIAAKCQQGFNLNFVLNIIRRVIRFFITDSHGYKICVSGRFTRKQIATYRWFKQGSLSLNTQNASVDYAQDSGFSKFGLFGIKLWVFGIANPQIN